MNRPRRVTTYLNDEEFSTLQRIAEFEGLTYAATLRMLIRKHGDNVSGNPTWGYLMTSEEIERAELAGRYAEFVNQLFGAPVSTGIDHESLISSVDGALDILQSDYLVGEKVLRLRFGLRLGSKYMTWAAVAKSIGPVSIERARQIQVRALRKLRHPMRSKALRHLVD